MKQIDEWPADWTARIGRAVQNARKDAGLSAAKLSERCGETGFPIARNTITNLENGRKESVPIHEVVTLARALDVAPIDLLYPISLDGELVEDYAAAIGDANFMVSGERGTLSVNGSRHALYADVARRTRLASIIVRRLNDGTLDEKTARDIIELHLTMLISAQKDLRLAGLPVPAVPDALAWWIEPGDNGQPRYVIPREGDPVAGPTEARYHLSIRPAEMEASD